MKQSMVRRIPNEITELAFIIKESLTIERHTFWKKSLEDAKHIDTPNISQRSKIVEPIERMIQKISLNALKPRILHLMLRKTVPPPLFYLWGCCIIPLGTPFISCTSILALEQLLILLRLYQNTDSERKCNKHFPHS